MGTVSDPRGLCERLTGQTSAMIPPIRSVICPGDLHSPYISVRGTLGGDRIDTVFAVCDDNRARLWRSHLRQ